MEGNYAGLSTARSNASPVRERDPNCIEMHLKNIEAELAESFNSAENLADKLKGELKGGQDGMPKAPSPSDVHGRMEQILNTVRCINQQLGRAHAAISG